jgi:hypothetical protein
LTCLFFAVLLAPLFASSGCAPVHAYWPFQTEPLPPDAPFARGAWVLTASAARSYARRDIENLTTAAFGVGWYALDGIGLNFEAIGNVFDNPRPPEPFGGGMNLILRIHLLRAGRVTIYGDGGAGLAFADSSVPPVGTRFNFTEQIGMGASFLLFDKVHFITGLRYFHLSNAGLGDRNPGVDAWSVNTGLMYEF